MFEHANYYAHGGFVVPLVCLSYNKMVCYLIRVPEHEFEKAYKSLRGLETMVNQFHSTMESLGNKVYDFVAIPPEWTTVDRIISFRLSDENLFFIHEDSSKSMCLFLVFPIGAGKKMVRGSTW